MKIYEPKQGILQIDDARIIFRNFSGAQSKFNREGDRNFALVIDDQESADFFTSNGWNVKIKAPRDEDDTPLMFLPIKVKFNERGPIVYLESGSSQNRLDEESVDILDTIDILSVDLDIRAFDWDVNGKTGRTAYLQSIRVIQDVDRFARDYDN